MSQYLKKFETYMEQLEQITKDEQDPHRQAIMQNYTRHHALEFAGRSTDIFAPEMTVPNPVYHMKLYTPEVVTYEGGQHILDTLYAFVGSAPMVLGDAVVAVGDWGVASRETVWLLLKGSTLADHGLEVDDLDPEATYIRQCDLAQFWPYTEDAVLIGEDVYQINEDFVFKAAPEDVFTLEDQANVARRFIVD